MEQSEKVVCYEMDSAPTGTTYEWHKQDDSHIATGEPSPILPSTCSTTEISPTEWEFVTYREIPYEPGDFWDELRNQKPVRNIVVTSSRLRALNPRIFTDFDENADKGLIEHDETETVLQDSSDNEEYAAFSVLNEEASQINYYRRKKSECSYSYRDSEMELSPESVTSKDSDFSLNSSLLSSDSDSDSWVSGLSKKARGKGARTNRIESSSGSSDVSDQILSGRRSPDSDESSLNTSSISDSSVSGILDSDDDLF